MNVSTLWQRAEEYNAKSLLAKSFFVQDFQSPALPIIMSNLLLIQKSIFQLNSE